MMDKLNQYLKAWRLTDPQPLAQTPTSHLYTVTYGGKTAVLKLLTEYGWEEQRGAAALRFWDGHGAIRLYESDEKAQLLEYVEGDELVRLVERGEDEASTRIIADVIAQLHAVPQDKPKDGLYPLERWFQSLFDRAAADEATGSESIYRRGATVAETLLSDPRDVRVLHGDIHHTNIRHSARRGWLAFDPKGVVGERTYDCANTLCNPFMGKPRYDELVHSETRLLRNAGILADELGIELPRLMAYTFAYTCLSAAWSLESNHEDSAEWALNIAAIVEKNL
jgi:streptomycin 6-kinase